MTARIREYCQALTDLLNGGGLGFTAERKNFPSIDRENLDDGDIVVLVAPGRQERSEPYREGFSMRRFGVDVMIATSVDPNDNDSTDAALDLAELIEDYIAENGHDLLEGALRVIRQDDTVDDESLNLRNEFETVISLEYEEAY